MSKRVASSFTWLVVVIFYFSCSCFSKKHEILDRSDERGRESSSPIILKNGSSVKTRSEIDRLVQIVLGQEKQPRRIAKEKLILLSKQSLADRTEVIESVLVGLDIPNRNNELVEPDVFGGWAEAVSILGEIRANEALPILIKCLTCNEGIGGASLHRYPVAKSLVLIGKPAVPFLENLLVGSDTGNLSRGIAISVLSRIGGIESHQALVNALSNDKNSELVSSIESGLKIVKKDDEK